MRKWSPKLLGLCIPFVLTGCGGGGGTNPTTSTTFSSWSGITPNSSVTISGISQAGTYTYDTANEVMTSRTNGSSSAGASYSATYDNSGNVIVATITPAGDSPISWSSSGGDTFGVLIINNDIDVAISADSEDYALAANPFGFGWDYQSFGIWTTGAGTGSGTYGAMSMGAETSGSSIPTSGSATYNGYTAGRFVNSANQDFFTSSAMAASANFATRSISFSTTNTFVTRDLINQSANSNLNMNGTLSYSAATNSITGSITTTGGLTGDLNGRFYGPSAEEIGGTFALTGGGLEAYAGAFGGKR